MDGKKKVSLKFEYKNGLIIVPVWYNNFLKLNFIFDTGAEHIILFKKELSDLIGTTYERRINLMGSDMSDSLYAYITRNVPIRLSNKVSVTRDIVVLENDRMRLDEILGLNIDGILGAGLFTNLIVQIDYGKKKIHFYHPEYFDKKKLKDYRKIDITLKNHKPYVNATLNQINRAPSIQSLLIDTGASLGLLLHHGENQDIDLPDIVIPGNLGSGIGGALEGYAGRIERLRIDTFNFNHILSHFQSLDSIIVPRDEVIRNGLLGNDILSRFDLCIDYVKETLYLKPRKKYNKGFAYDKSGILLYAFGEDLNEFYVKRVIPGSPAALAGVQTGDVIKKIGWWSHRFYSLEKITNKLAGKAGDKIKLKLDRGGKKVKVSFVLRDLFDKKIP